jgi:biopolymer transport protein ExbD
MANKRSKTLWDSVVQADLLPVMNIMFLLIPALLLAMEFASMAEIAVSPPRISSDPSTQQKPPTQEPLAFKVMIRRDGFAASVQSKSVAEIPLRSGELDYAALAETARSLKVAHPDEIGVTVSAELDVPMHRVVQTLDTLRGDGCKLGDIARGEQAGGACMFYAPVIES